MNSILGVNEIMRFDFKARRGAEPFFDLGPGINAFSLRLPELGRKMEFSLQAGLGIKRRLPGGRMLTLEYRFTHFSDAGTVPPNQGINLHTILFGITQF